ncbi:MAG: trypsin-like peptidase domain-containing protein [Cyanobacteria bacterium J06627_8]
MKRIPHFLQPIAVRLTASGMLTLKIALLMGAIASELILTSRMTPFTEPAIAQSMQAENTDEAIVFVQTEQGTGSGVIVDPNGLIVTNAHVIEGARQVVVNIQGRAVEAEVVSMGSSQCLDLALLQVEGYTNLPTIELASTDDVHKRQSVYAVGYPGGIPTHSPSTVQGIISNIYPHEGFLQLDAAINPGNSGGAVVDRDTMTLLGIATARLSEREGITFAVSVEKVSAFIDAYRQNVAFPIGQFVIPGREQNSELQAITPDGNIISGMLEEHDNRFCSDYSAADLYTFDAEAGQSIMIDMEGQQIGTYLMLVDPDGQMIAQGGSEDGATILEKLSQSGTYTVIANALESGELGNYQLQISTPIMFESGAIDVSTPPCTSEGILCRTYSFAGQAEQTVSIAHRADFVPFLMLLDPNGDVVASGQAEPQGVFTLDLATDGWYELLIMPAQSDERGQFLLSVHDAQDLIELADASQR